MTFETISSGFGPDATEKIRILSKAGRSVPCIDHYIGICPAPCLLTEKALAEHKKNVSALESFLKGDRSDVITGLEEDMRSHAAKLEFEEAQKAKDRLAAIRSLSEKQIARNSVKDEVDAFILYERENRFTAAFCKIRSTELRSLSRHGVENPLGDDAETVRSAFLSELYAEHDADLPKTILLDSMPEDAVFLNFLAEKGIRIEIPQVGPKAELLSFLKSNAASYALKSGLEALSKKRATKETSAKVLAALGFEAPKKGPIVFECYDISHTDGHFTVASRSVSTNGKHDNAKYRKYKIASIADGKIDDFASLREVLYRRTLEGLETDNFPTLLVIDGGKGQLSAAREGMDRAIKEKGMVTNVDSVPAHESASVPSGEKAGSASDPTISRSLI